MALERPFLKHISEKEESFDEIMKMYLPKGQGLFDYWEHSLMVDRAEDILRLRASGELEKMKYEP